MYQIGTFRFKDASPLSSKAIEEVNSILEHEEKVEFASSATTPSSNFVLILLGVVGGLIFFIVGIGGTVLFILQTTKNDVLMIVSGGLIVCGIFVFLFFILIVLYRKRRAKDEFIVVTDKRIVICCRAGVPKMITVYPIESDFMSLWYLNWNNIDSVSEQDGNLIANCYRDAKNRAGPTELVPLLRLQKKTALILEAIAEQKLLHHRRGYGAV